VLLLPPPEEWLGEVGVAALRSIPLEMVLTVTQLLELGVEAAAEGVTRSPTV